MSGPASIGERAAYALAGAAMRQAVDRAVALGDKLTPADHSVLVAVLYMTITYSKLSDRVAQPQLARLAGVSTRQVRRSLGRLAHQGVIVWSPGRGAGVLTAVGVPPAGEKADNYQSALGLPPLSALNDGESGQKPGEKAATPRARANHLEVPRRKNELLDEGEVVRRSKQGPQVVVSSRLKSDDVSSDERIDELLRSTDRMLRGFGQARDVPHLGDGRYATHSRHAYQAGSLTLRQHLEGVRLNRETIEAAEPPPGGEALIRLLEETFDAVEVER